MAGSGRSNTWLDWRAGIVKNSSNVAARPLKQINSQTFTDHSDRSGKSSIYLCETSGFDHIKNITHDAE